jgi:hypothetical protein
MSIPTATMSAARNPLAHCDLVERVDAHLDVGQIDLGPVCLHPELYVLIDHPLHGPLDFHGAISYFGDRLRPEGGIAQGLGAVRGRGGLRSSKVSGLENWGSLFKEGGDTLSAIFRILQHGDRFDRIVDAAAIDVVIDEPLADGEGQRRVSHDS